MSEQYNGWTNWETWVTQFYFEHYDVEDMGYINAEQVADETLDAYGLGQALRDDLVEMENMEDLPESSWVENMVNMSLHEVNFTEIAEHIIDSVKEWDSYKEYVAELADEDDDDELVLS